MAEFKVGDWVIARYSHYKELGVLSNIPYRIIRIESRTVNLRGYCIIVNNKEVNCGNLLGFGRFVITKKCLVNPNFISFLLSDGLENG